MSKNAPSRADGAADDVILSVRDFPHARLDPSERALLERLQSSTSPAEGGCVFWTGRTNFRGLPVFAGALFKPEYLVRRLVWRLVTGSFPASGKCLAMRCGNPLCLTPEHLMLLGQSRLQLLAAHNGRYCTPSRRAAISRAMAARAAPLSAQQIERARSVPHGGGRALAREFNVSASLISMIRLQKTRRSLFPGASVFCAAPVLACSSPSRRARISVYQGD